MIEPVTISAGDQFKPEFRAFSPNNRMPAIIDRDPVDGGEPVTVFESGAILLYLAEKTGRFLPSDLRGRKTVTEWLFWQMGGLAGWPGRTIISGSTRRKRSPTPSTAMSMRPTAFTVYWIAASPIASSWPETTTASPTWQPIRGSCRGNASSRTSTTSSMFAAGSTAPGNGQPPYAPMPRSNHTLPNLP